MTKFQKNPVLILVQFACIVCKCCDTYRKLSNKRIADYRETSGSSSAW